MDAKSARRQLQARVTVPADASTVTSVVLTAIGSAAHLSRDPMAAARVAITAAAATATPTAAPPALQGTTPLSVSGLPAIPTASPTLSPGGNAAGLFPTLKPSADPTSTSSATATGKTDTRAVADTSALPEGSRGVGAQLAGLGALALAFVLAVTRLSIRRRPQAAGPVPPPSAASGPGPQPPSRPGRAPDET